MSVFEYNVVQGWYHRKMVLCMVRSLEVFAESATTAITACRTAAARGIETSNTAEEGYPEPATESIQQYSSTRVSDVSRESNDTK